MTLSQVAQRIDVSFQRGRIDTGEQGVPLCGLYAEDYCRPIRDYARTNFITAKARARHMVREGAGCGSRYPSLATRCRRAPT